MCAGPLARDSCELSLFTDDVIDGLAWLKRCMVHISSGLALWNGRGTLVLTTQH